VALGSHWRYEKRGGFCVEGWKERERFGDLDLDRRIIMKWILKK